MGHKARTSGKNSHGSRLSWIDADNVPQLDDHVSQLEHFTESLADGQIDKEELATQEKNLITAMKAVESELDDETHAKVTKLLVELTAYNVMQLLHTMAVERIRSTVN